MSAKVSYVLCMGDSARFSGTMRASGRYYAMKDARRLYERDNDGTRVFCSDADADARREEARQAMLAACQQ